MDASVDSEFTEHTSTLVRALVRVARHHGLSVTEAQVARADPFDTPEPTVSRLLAMARRMGLSGQHTRVGPGGLSGLAHSTPAIALLPDGRASLLSSVREQNGAWFAMVEDLSGARQLTALVDEPRLFSAWHGDLVLIKRTWRVTDERQPFGIPWLFGQVVRERQLFPGLLHGAVGSDRHDRRPGRGIRHVVRPGHGANRATRGAVARGGGSTWGSRGSRLSHECRSGGRSQRHRPQTADLRPRAL
jgi:hypothetical protein